MAIYLGSNKVDGNVSIKNGSTVEYTPTISSGTELGKLSIDGTDSSIYAPSIPANISAFTNDAGYLTAHQDISGKQDTLVSGTNIKTINGNSILGDGNLVIDNTAFSYLVTPGDQRSVATTPNTYSNKLVYQGLKTNSVIGSPTSDTYSYLVGLRGWSDSSGGNSHELAFNNTGIFTRSGATTSWGSWRKIYDSGNLVAATTSAQGLMSAADKTAINKIGTGTLNTSNKNCIAAINELKSALGLGGIVDYSVSEGEAYTAVNNYIRFAGNIQVCFGTAYNCDNESITFAKSFSGIPFIIAGYASTDATSRIMQYVTNITQLSSSGFNAGSGISDYVIGLHYIAIGKYA